MSTVTDINIPRYEPSWYPANENFKEFQSEAQKFFNSDGSTHFRWNLIYQFMKDNFDYLTQYCQVVSFERHLVNKFTDFQCEDVHVVAFAINLQNWILDVIHRLDATEIANRQEYLSKQSSIIKKLLKKEGTPGDLWNAIDRKLPVAEFLTANQYLKFGQLLARYGLLCSNTLPTQKDLITKNIILQVYRSLIEDNLDSVELKQAIEAKYNIADERLTLGYYNNLDEGQKAKFRRECLVVHGVQMIFYLFCNEHGIEDHIKCFKLYFEAIPEPLLTVKEVEKTLYSPFTESENVVTVPGIQECLERFGKSFHCSNTLEPRTLKHLSRCALREELRQYGPLLKIVPNLKLPGPIIDYILVNEE